MKKIIKECINCSLDALSFNYEWLDIKIDIIIIK